MADGNYFSRLVWHGGKFFFQLGAILGGAILAGTWASFVRLFSMEENSDVRMSPLIAGKADAWMEFQAGRINAAELAYYESISDE